MPVMFPRAALTLGLALGVLVVPIAGEAQQPGRIYQVGYLSAGSREPWYVDAFLHAMRALGWTEGQNFVVEYRWAEGKNERLPALAAELVQRKVEVIVAPTEPTALAARNATRNVPIVMLELLKEAVPHAVRVAVLSNPANPSHASELSQVENAARRLRIRLQRLDARGPEEFERIFGAMAQERADAALVLVDAMFAGQRTRLADLALKHRLPTMHGIGEFVTSGGLMAYGVNVAEFVGGAAHYVDRILKGAKPADLPVRQPTKFELTINSRTAKALGLTIPPSLLLRADRVVE